MAMAMRSSILRNLSGQSHLGKRSYFMMAMNASVVGPSIQSLKTVKNSTTLDKGIWHMEHNEIGIAALQDGQYEKAVESFVKAVEQDPDNAVGYINLGNVFASLGDAEKAEPFFQKAITLDVEAGTAYYGLANLYYNKERYEEASKLYETAIRQGVEE